MVVGLPRRRALVERDHARGPPFLAALPLDPGQEGQRGLRLHRPLPDAQGLGGVAGLEVGVAQRHRGGHEISLHAEGVAEGGDAAA